MLSGSGGDDAKEFVVMIECVDLRHEIVKLSDGGGSEGVYIERKRKPISGSSVVG